LNNKKPCFLIKELQKPLVKISLAISRFEVGTDDIELFRQRHWLKAFDIGSASRRSLRSLFVDWEYEPNACGVTSKIGSKLKKGARAKITQIHTHRVCAT
jgi:hypothetical protein